LVKLLLNVDYFLHKKSDQLQLSINYNYNYNYLHDYFGLNKQLLHSSSDCCILAFLSKFSSNNAAGIGLYVKFDVVIQIIVVCSIYSKGTLFESPLILVFIYQKIYILRDRSVKILIF
jgi:hypothetical protein